MLDWNENNTFTKAHADVIKNRGACERVYDFVGLTVRECAEKEPSTALEYASDLITPERLERCAEKDPSAALAYATDRLTPERIDWCAKQEPWVALMYAKDHLTPETLDCCERTQYA